MRFFNWQIRYSFQRTLCQFTYLMTIRSQASGAYTIRARTNYNHHAKINLNKTAYVVKVKKSASVSLLAGLVDTAGLQRISSSLYSFNEFN